MNGIKVIDTNTAPHYIWEEHCDGWHFMDIAGLSVIREKMPPGTREKKHYHQNSNQFFYILNRLATFEISGNTYNVRPQQGISIPLGMIHCIANEETYDLDFLVISQPKSHGDRINVET
jgi:mannose-6-phosphate isomerase-like protein (cupin superfamily)